MFKKLSKKALPIIMATMLVASMGAVGASAVETATEESTVVAQATGEVTTFIDELYGIKLESSDMELNEAIINVGEFDHSFMPGLNLTEKMRFIDVFTERYEYANLEEKDVTAYLSYERDDCYIIYQDYYSSAPVQVAAEYVDGCYKFTMPGSGLYIINENPLAEGEGELIEQTLVDETTGVSVKGMIPTGSQIEVVDLMADLTDFIPRDEFGEISESDLAILETIDCYMINVVRNFNIAATQGDLAVSLPNENEDYEVRFIFDIVSDSTLGDTILNASEFIDQELFEQTMSNEEFADEINLLVDSILPVLASEYVDGNYVVNEENPGYFMVLPKNMVYVTAEDVAQMREEYNSSIDDDINGEVSEPSTEAPTEVATEASTEAPTQASTNAPTQAQQNNTNSTSSTTQGKGTVNTSNSSNIPMLLAIIGTATATMVAFKKRATK